MLAKETDRNFIVYPSWAELAARWEDLPRFFADPLKSGFLEPNFPYRRFDYPETIQPYELIDGPEGGGIIVWWGDPYRGRWLPMCVLTGGGGNLLEFNGLRGFTFDRDPHDPLVCTLEPPSNRKLVQWGIVKRPRIYNTGVSYEHAASAGDAVYWLVRTKPKGKKRTLAACSQLPEWGRAFVFDVTPIADPPGDLLAETAPWFGNSDEESTWFEVSHTDKGLGLNFAVVGYLGHLLRHVIGPSFNSMHLIAQIEGEPNFRRRWHGEY
jgi:hypothetical protein